MEILANLNPEAELGGELTNLFIRNNPGLIDFSPLEKYSWNDWGGFKGK